MLEPIKKFILLLISIACLSSDALLAQESKPKSIWFEKHPIVFALGNFSVGMPFSGVFIKEFYPMAYLGTEFYYLNRKQTQLYQTVYIGGYYNAYSTSAIFVNTEIGYRYTIGFGLFADANLGVGYSQLFCPNAIYNQDKNGEYEQVADLGSPSFMVDFAFSLGYDFSNQFKRPISLFFRYGNYIQMFYNSDIPALPQNSFQLGTRFFIRNKLNRHVPE